MGSVPKSHGIGAASVSEGQKRRRSQRGRATPLVLAALASAGAACSHAGGTGSATVPPAGSCAHFVTMVRTNKPSYAPSQTVIMSVTQVNEGPACYGIPPEWCGNLHAFASAINSAGEDVWDYGASKTIPGQITCPFAPAPGLMWPARR